MFSCNCPNCKSQNVRSDYDYKTFSNGSKKMLLCRECRCSFSETKGIFLEGIRTPIITIWNVINARTEGMAFNATCRVFGITKNTLLSWERKFSDLYRVLFIYSMAHGYIQMVIEGDEFYTKVNKNVPPEKSSGWTVVLMD